MILAPFFQVWWFAWAWSRLYWWLQSSPWFASGRWPKRDARRFCHALTAPRVPPGFPASYEGRALSQMGRDIIKGPRKYPHTRLSAHSYETEEYSRTEVWVQDRNRRCSRIHLWVRLTLASNNSSKTMFLNCQQVPNLWDMNISLRLHYSNADFFF